LLPHNSLEGARTIFSRDKRNIRSVAELPAKRSWKKNRSLKVRPLRQMWNYIPEVGKAPTSAGSEAIDKQVHHRLETTAST
jgi:hypothetical protein